MVPRKIGFVLALIAILAMALGLRLYRFVPPVSFSTYSAQPVAQLPPGLHSDEAFDALAALRLLNSRSLVPYSMIDEGRTVAHIYLTALVIAITGPIAEASRISSVIASLLAMAGMAWLVYELFRAKLSATELRVAILIAVAEVAGTYWFVHFGRMGLDVIGTPWLMLPAFAMLWRWLHRPTLISSFIAGGLMGLALYSYLPSYFVPVVVAPTIIIYWWTTAKLHLTATHMLVLALALALTILPLVNYAINNLADFTHRIADTKVLSNTDVMQNVVLTLGGVFVRGDSQVFYNLPNRPMLDLIQSLLALVGLWVAIRRSKQPEYLFILLWSGIMLLPSILSASSPAFNRLAGAVPGILMLVTLGGWQIYRRLTAARWRWLGSAAIALAVVATFSGTAYDYFVRWPTSNGLLYSFSLAERIQAEAINALAPTTDVYLSPSDSQRSMFAYLWQDQMLARSFNGRKCTVGPVQADRATVWLINASEDKRTTDRLKALYPSIQSQPIWISNGTTIMRQLTLPAGSTAQLPAQPIGQLADLAQLLSATSDTSIERGAEFHTTLLWKFKTATTEDWTESVHLLNANQQVLAQDDSQPCGSSYPTSVWRPSEVMIEDRKLSIPADLPSGEYTLAVSFYRLSDGTRLPAVDSTGHPIGDSLILDRIVIP